MLDMDDAVAQSPSERAFLLDGVMGPDKGKVLGSQSLDGYNHWRIDYDLKSSKQFHVNWRRIYRDKKGNCVHETGAYLLPGGQDSYWDQRERMPKL